MRRIGFKSPDDQQGRRCSAHDRRGPVTRAARAALGRLADRRARRRRLARRRRRVRPAAPPKPPAPAGPARAGDHRAARRPDEPDFRALRLHRRARAASAFSASSTAPRSASCPAGGVTYPGALVAGLTHLQGPRASRARRRARRAPISWTVDTLAPTASISYPTDGLTLASGDWGARCAAQASICGTARDAHGVSTVCSRSSATGAAGGAAAHSTSRASRSGRPRSRRATGTRRAGRMRCAFRPTASTRSTCARPTTRATRRPPPLSDRPLHDRHDAAAGSRRSPPGPKRPRRRARRPSPSTTRSPARGCSAAATARASRAARARPPTARSRSAPTASKSRRSDAAGNISAAGGLLVDGRKDGRSQRQTVHRHRQRRRAARSGRLADAGDDADQPQQRGRSKSRR